MDAPSILANSVGPRSPALLAAVLTLACAAPELPPPDRVLVVGLDGATNKLIDGLIEGGELPHLAALAREGVRASVRPERPILSPRIWTTFATGVAPQRHGVLDWVRRYFRCRGVQPGGGAGRGAGSSCTRTWIAGCPPCGTSRAPPDEPSVSSTG